MIKPRCFGVFLLILTIGCSALVQPTTGPTTHFAGEIDAFAKQDAATPPPASPILFVGSSTIRFWETSKAFPNLPVLNRGFGGSEISDVLVYYDRVVLKYHPSMIVFYSGDNDLNRGKSVERVVADMRVFVTKVRTDLPATRLLVIGIKPSVARWKLEDSIRQTNREFQKLVNEKPGDVFVDVEAQVLGADGKPRAKLFRADGLHFNEKGYEILNTAVKPYLAIAK